MPSTSEFDAPDLRCYHQIAGWSSLVARWAHNPKVGGSNPPPATNLKSLNLQRYRFCLKILQLFVSFINVQNFPKFLQAVIPWRALGGCKQQTKSIWSPASYASGNF